MDILPGFLQVCKIQEATDNWIDSLLGGTEKDEREMESDNEGNEKKIPRACLRRFLQTSFAINQFKLAELDDMLVVLLEIHNRSVPSSKSTL